MSEWRNSYSRETSQQRSSTSTKANLNSSVVIDIEEENDSEIICVEDLPPTTFTISKEGLDLDNSELKDEEDDEIPVPITQDLDSQEMKMEIEETDTSLMREIQKNGDKDNVQQLQNNEDLQKKYEAKLNKMKQNEIEQMAVFKTFTKFSASERIFPDVRVSDFHTVTFSLSGDYKPGNQLLPFPDTNTIKWDLDHVPMPYAPQHLVVIKTSSEEKGSGANDVEKHQSSVTKIKFWARVSVSLEGRIFHCCQDIGRAMRYYVKRASSCNVLQYAIENLMYEEEREILFSKVLPSIVKYCLDLPNLLTCPLPLLKRGRNYSITLTQLQIASLLANSFFSTFPKRLSNDEAYPSINFNELFSCDPDNPKFICRANKVRCILHYFERVTEQMPNGVVTFTRKSIKTNKAPIWNESVKKLRKFAVLYDGTIEDTGSGLMQVDFANRFVGGGVLGNGAVQEEILYVIYPELLVSRLFTESLAANEALVITGSERFSQYKGYASGFTYDGDYIDCTPWDSKGRKCSQIVAIDALYIRDRVKQFHPRNVTRELNKAYVGFSIPVSTSSSAAIATGKWGCGAFNGDPELKAILQLLAASQAGKDLLYFTFGDMDLQDTLIDVHRIIKDMTIKEIFALLKQYYNLFCTAGKPSYSLSEFLREFAYATQVPDDESSGESKPELKPIHPNKFYPSDQPLGIAPITPKSSKNNKPRVTATPASSSRTSTSTSSKTPNHNWLTNLDKFKASFNSSNRKKDKNEFDELDDSVSSKTLTDEQITTILTEDGEESMDQTTNDNDDSNDPPVSLLTPGQIKRRKNVEVVSQKSPNTFQSSH